MKTGGALRHSAAAIRPHTSAVVGVCALAVPRGRVGPELPLMVMSSWMGVEFGAAAAAHRRATARLQAGQEHAINQLQKLLPPPLPPPPPLFLLLSPLSLYLLAAHRAYHRPHRTHGDEHCSLSFLTALRTILPARRCGALLPLPPFPLVGVVIALRLACRHHPPHRPHSYPIPL